MNLVGKVLSLALNNVRESQFRTDVGREFQTDGAAVLKERLPTDICLKGTCSSGPVIYKDLVVGGFLVHMLFENDPTCCLRTVCNKVK